MYIKKMKIVEDDPWLQPVSKDVLIRYERFLDKLNEINNSYNTLIDFARAYNYYGIHYDENKSGWYYREWAPSANSLSLCGDFNDWNIETHKLNNIGNGNWEIFLEKEKYKNTFIHGSKLKVCVNSLNGIQLRIPAYITKVCQDYKTKDFSAQLWFDKYKWSAETLNFTPEKHLFIYECHVGMAQEKDGIGTYIEFADSILPRVKNLGYNAIQLMAVQEHPYYASFGYHVSNLFAPSSRFGTPDDLKYLIDKAHKLGIAVIMDIVHSHMVKNINEGLNCFDGTDYQYFHSGSRGIHPQWDSLLYDYGKLKVKELLLSNISYWLNEYKFDGFRFDGVGSMMYFHHGDAEFSTPQQYFTQGVEWDAVTYLQLANNLVKSINKNAITIAEDVTGMAGLTSPINDGGIGFDYRLGMGIPDFWIKLLKEYTDENWDINFIWKVLNNRLYNVNTVAYCESHDQALVGDKTIAFRLMDKEMYFSMDTKSNNYIIDRGIALHKIIRLLTISIGGNAYLNFMGNEFGHPEWIDFPRKGNNWSYKYAKRQWQLVSNDNLKYKYLNTFDKEMISTIKINNVFNEQFANQMFVDNEKKILIYSRNNLIFAINLNPTQSYFDYKIKIMNENNYKIILNSDSKRFGGFDRVNDNLLYQTVKNENNNNILSIYLPNRTALIFKNN